MPLYTHSGRHRLFLSRSRIDPVALSYSSCDDGVDASPAVDIVGVLQQ